MEIKKHTEVTLILDESEAKWLKGFMQNPFHPEESPYDKKIRESFWRALDAEGVKST